MFFLWLPAKVQLFVLVNLSFRDVVRCRAVCRHLRGLIDSRQELALICEFGAAGMKENPNCLDSIEKKVEKLWQSNVAWANLHWLCRRDITLSGTGRLFDVSGGLFFHTTAGTDANAGNGTTVECFRLPSRREPSPVYMPQRIMFDVPLVEMAVESTRDLIIGVELTSFRNSRSHTIVCNVHARSITTNEIHPDAAQPIISSRFVSPMANFDPIVQVCGNHIGILLARKSGYMSPVDSFDMFLLLDWTTGVSKASMSSSNIQETWEAFCFLTTDSVLIPSARNNLLNVYSFDDTPESLMHAVSFLLPDILPRYRLQHIYLRSQPCPSSSTYHAHPCGDEPPFTADPDEAIIILALDYQYVMDGEPDRIHKGYNRSQAAAIPRRALTHFVRLVQARKPGLTWTSSTEHRRGRTYPAAATASSTTTSASPCVLGPRCLHENVYKHLRKYPCYKRSPHIHTHEWIMRTHWGLDAVTPSLRCCAYGSRYLGMSSRVELGGTRTSSIVIYDFNLCNERRGRGHALEEENVRPYPEADEEFNEDENWDYDEHTGNRRWPVHDALLVRSPTVLNFPKVFLHRFITALPHRVIKTEMVLPWDSAVLDGERIIGLKFTDNEAGNIHALDVIVI